MSLSEKYKKHIEKAFEKAENLESKITPEIIAMEGMSGTKTRHFYNNLLEIDNARYLEIGTWKGSSVCSAMCKNKAKVICIDNWSEFGGPKAEFIKNFHTFRGENDAWFIEKDCYQVNTDNLPTFNIYMYDGNHSSENHYKSLTHFYNCLDDVFIFIVDDWNWQDVRDGTYHAIANLNLKILYQKEVRMTWDNSVTAEPQLSKEWWNGIYVAVLQKQSPEIASPRVTLKIDYQTCRSELCDIGKKYDTDKSSHRNNVTNERHCHPYTLFYEGLFQNKKNEPLDIAELGILEGSSLLMWREYFPHSQIHGFEYNYDLISHFKQKMDNNRITLSYIDVTNQTSILNAFESKGVMYDIIIEDTTHQFDDQIRVINNVHKWLKPGGILIIEDIFKRYREEDYIRSIASLLPFFQDYYFVELDHVNRNSTGWDNDKLFVLVKGGGVPIFRNENKITIITPSYRVNNLMNLKKSIDFNYVEEWIIVYDGSKIKESPNLFLGEERIKEYVYEGPGRSGNPQRNYALTKVANPTTMLYFLDDDNIIHPNLYQLLHIVDNTKFYTFNQAERLRGNIVQIGKIDTAMSLIPFRSCNDVTWIPNLYEADGYYIKACCAKCKDHHIFVDNDLCFYNKIV